VGIRASENPKLKFTFQKLTHASRAVGGVIKGKANI
jgi:hypothetical protein